MKKEKAPPKPKAVKAKKEKAKPVKKAYAYMIGNTGPFGIDHALAYAKQHKKSIDKAKDMKALFMSKVEAKPGEKCQATGVALIPGEADGAAPSSTPHINRKEFDKQIRVGLEGDEREVAFTELKVARQELKDQTDKRDAVKSEWKEIIRLAAARVEDAFATLEWGRNEIVRVEQVRDFSQGKYTETIIKTGRVLEDRPLTDEDGQPELQGLDAESPASIQEEPAKPYDASDAINGSRSSNGPGFELEEAKKEDADAGNKDGSKDEWN